MALTVHVEVDETGTYVGEVQELPGCVTQGSTFDELLKNLRDAIAGDLQVRRQMGYPAPEGQRMRLLVDASV